jgi:hypothetical protein
MDFIMRLYKRPEHRFSRRLLVLLLLGVASLAQASGFEVRQAKAHLEQDRLVVTADMNLELSDEAEEALSKGIPLDILLEFRLYRDRRWLWDDTLAEWTLRTRLSYHALSGLYLVTLQESKDAKTFGSQREALDYVGTLTRVSFPMPPTGSDDKTGLLLGLRARLDVRTLPAPLQPLAYVSSAWGRLKTKWTKWPIHP